LEGLKPKALGLELQKAEHRACLMERPKPLGLANWMVPKQMECLRACPREKPKALCLDVQKADLRACLRGKPKT
jgi:hypothetical protein